MAKGGEAREGGALKTAVIVAGGLALAWVAMETAFKPFLDRLRGAVSRNTDPAPDPDQVEAPAAAAEEEKAPAPEEPSAPPASAAVEEKVAELEEKVEEATATAAAADDADKAE
ncbi:unnamed protein product [Urochloa decumbens]|uniref:Outer envelope membrane protein 7 n=1 Tax=Urochloa decumbens TaxID=240449 RepID=A0ABC8V6K2_9POAL